MSSAGSQSPPLRPSVFISYASEDRAAARTLRDALAAAGIEVWYDENELVGGDAWDQKIRRQIRDCDYFMPIISAETERRKEGYFRREWRLASERTMDMADDVLFLLPVAIDSTSETNARVPEKFLNVQWLRCPAGQPTPSLEALTKRLLAGDHAALPRPPLMTRIPLVPPQLVDTTTAPWTVPPGTGSSTAQKPQTGDDAPPPMPPFPPAPEKSGVGPWFKFIAEMIWWALTAVWLVMMRFPRWARVMIAIWVLFSVIGTCRSGNSSSSENRTRDASEVRAPTSDEIKSAIAAAKQAMLEAKEGKGPDHARGGNDPARRQAKNALDPNAFGKPLVLAPFSVEPTDAPGEKLAEAAFAACQEKLLVARPGEVAVTVVSVGNHNDEALAALGRNLGARFILGGHVTMVNNTHTLVVRVVRVPAGTVAWTADFPLEGTDPSATATKISENVLPLISSARGKEKR